MVTVIKKGTPKEEIRRKIKEAVEKAPKKSIKKYAGALNIKIDPLDYQIAMRNEWE